MNKKGFTLVEVLSVIIILSALLLLSAISVRNLLNDSKEKLAISEATQLVKASQTYSLEYSDYSVLDIHDEKLDTDVYSSFTGEVATDKNGNSRIALVSNGYCVKKDFLDEDYTTTKNTRNCTLKPVSFEEDTWSTIQYAVLNNDISKYKVGDTKTIHLGGNLNVDADVRLVNTSNKSTDGCGGVDFSETACGFVVEFVNIVGSYQINSIESSIGGWQESELRKKLNGQLKDNDTTKVKKYDGEFFKSLPNDLKYVLKETTVLSGHEASAIANYKTKDKIYIFTSIEIGISSDLGKGMRDTAEETTKVLDYYAMENITKVKTAIGETENQGYWLRAARIDYDDRFIRIDVNGKGTRGVSTSYYGVVPAFRIG